jgi:hypothetical protein
MEELKVKQLTLHCLEIKEMHQMEVPLNAAMSRIDFME